MSTELESPSLLGAAKVCDLAVAHGYASSDEAYRAFHLRGLYPMDLSDSGVDLRAWGLFFWWLNRLGKDFSSLDRPWVPLGRVGPVLVLGHYAPVEAQGLLPDFCSQPVLLSMQDYERARASAPLASSRRGGTSHCSLDWVEPQSRLSAPFIAPSTEQGALHFMAEYLPHEPEAYDTLRNSLALPSGKRLPFGYRAALQVMMRRGAVADPSIIKPWNGLTSPMREMLASPLFAVSQFGKNLWVAAPSLPQRATEDRLLNALGEGWRVHLVLAEGLVIPRGDELPRADPLRRGVSRTRHRLDARSAVTTEEALTRKTGAGAEIRLEAREVANLSHYDPRRPDREPARVFLWSLVEALRSGASDLHLEPGLEKDRVRARIDGVLEEWLVIDCDFGQALISAAKEMLGLPAERFLPQDGSCAVFFGEESCSLRVSSYPIRRCRQKLVLRILPRRGGAPALSALLPENQASLLRRACHAPSGLILVCGPTGSGKTTTVFSALSELNTAGRNITTMEDPVEYEIEGLNQAELDPYRGVGWDPLLRGFLRQDPDAGLLGEIRDRDTAETAIRQALTGHIVFATLHTMSCAQTIERLADIGVNPEMLGSALTLIVSQRLVRRLCPYCRSERKSDEDSAQLFRRHGLPNPEKLWSASLTGCPECRQGFHGRVAAVEMLPVTADVIGLIEKRSRAREFQDWAKRSGLPSVYESALLLAAKGETTVDEAREWQPIWEDYEYGKGGS